MKRIGKVLEAIFLVISFLLIFWVAGSWIEVICKNLDPEPMYWPLNFFVLLKSFS